ncbi:translocation/assembly module TamB domain-containing protein [Thermophagus sp. OGC60D27]|uniref:translocation/assembly module TamB domain-containing protein n=1 Tax=Thermophagus sp. OGC60D27 TaxID=3458415 RepID=UPI0040381A23
MRFATLTRNYNKILIILLGILIGLPLVGSVFFMLPGVQTRIVAGITQRLSNDLNTEISIGRVQALPFSGIRLDNFLIRDLNNDTLLFSPGVHAEIDYFSLLKKHFFIGRVTLDQPQINISEYNQKLNFYFLIDSIGSNRADTSQWHYSVRGFRINDGNISFTHSVLHNPNLKHDTLSFNQVNIDLERTSGVADSLNFRLNNLTLHEKLGLSIQSGGARGQVRPDKISIDDFFIKTPFSEINIDRFEIPVNPEKTIAGSNNRFLAEIKKIYLSPKEIALYLKKFPQIETSLGLSGTVFGSGQNLKGRDISLLLGRETRINLSFDISDLSNYQETFLFMDIKNLETTPSDLVRIAGRAQSLQGNHLPALGTIQYRGNLTGFITDLVAYGNFTTAMGSISTDIGITFNQDQSISYSGALKTINFKLDDILGRKHQFGDLSMNVDINGSWKNKTNYATYINGKIQKFEWNQYLYQNIDINGLLTHQRFDGAVAVVDQYGNLNFNGEIDLSAHIPRFQFTAMVENFMPDRLNILPGLEEGIITLTMNANFEGDNLDDLSGLVSISDGLIYTPHTSLEIDSLSLKAFRDDNTKRLSLRSDFIEADLIGEYHFSGIRQSFLQMIADYLPSVHPTTPHLPISENQFKFDVSFDGFDKVLKLFYPNLSFANRGNLKGEVDFRKHIFDINASFENLSVNNIIANDIQIYANTNRSKNLQIVTRAKQINWNDKLNLYNFSIHQMAGKDTLDMNIFWNNWDAVTNSGAIYTTTAFRREKNEGFYFATHLKPSTMILEDSLWNINEARLLYTPQSISIQGLDIHHQKQRLALNGFLHRKSEDGLRLLMDNIDIFQLFKGRKEEGRHYFGGMINGSLEIKNYYREPLWKANLSIDDFSFDGDTAGFFSIASWWDQNKEAVVVNTSLKDGDRTPLTGQGTINPRDNSLAVDLQLDRLNVSFLETFIGKILQDFKATASGNLNLTGPLSKPLFTGQVNVDEGQFNVDLLQTSYSIKDSVWFYPNEIRFRDVTVQDEYGKTGSFNGSIYHTGFKNMVYNLQVDINNQLVLDTKAKDNPYYYGTVFAKGKLLVTGTTGSFDLSISGTTLDNTRFFIPMNDTEEAEQSNFIRFVSPKNYSSGNNTLSAQNNSQKYTADLSGMELNMEIEVTPAAQIEIIFDSAAGDMLSTTGNGNIQILLDRQGNLNFFGEYEINDGEYLFSLQNLVNKKFIINQGGNVTWQGDPYKARINMTAVYKVKAPLSDLVGPISDGVSGDNQDIYRRIPIYCNLKLSGPLERPGIKFDIEAPTLSESRESYILDLISSEDEMNRQVLSLLVLNRFYTPDYLRMENTESTQTNNAALVTTTEMLSNQLSRWLSNISSDVDVGVSYRPEDNLTSEEIEVALSTQMFNNRVTINGNVGYGKYQTNTSKMVGDFDMDVKLNPVGTIRAKAYTRSNDDIIYETSPTTQGIGISFKEEFDKFTDLLHKYWKAITGKKEDEDTSQNPQSR